MNDITRETNGQANGEEKKTQQQQQQQNPKQQQQQWMKKNWQLAQPQNLSQGSHEIADLLN